jgi:hypothetical protein
LLNKKTFILASVVLGGSIGLLAINNVITLDSLHPTNQVSQTGANKIRWEPSSAVGIGTGATWAHAWFDYTGGNSYSSTWNGAGWRTGVPLIAPGSRSTQDVNLAWDPTSTAPRFPRFVLASLDLTQTSIHSVWYAYSTDLNATNWTFVASAPFAGGTIPPNPPPGCGVANWDYPSIGVDATGRIIIGAVYFYGAMKCGFWTVESNDGLTFTSPHLVGTLPGPQSRVVATNNLFHAFVPTLNVNNVPISIQRWQSSDGMNWGNPLPLASFGAPWNNTPDVNMQPPSTCIYYAPLLAAQGYTNGLWTVAFQALNGAYNNIMICTSDRGCGWANAASDDQFLVGTSVSGDSAYWVNYLTYQNPPARNPPLMMQALYFAPGSIGIGATTSTNLQVTSWWPKPDRCFTTTGTPAPETCYAMGDFNTIASNPFKGATTPFICSNLSVPPCNQTGLPGNLYQDFVKDPQVASDLVNFTPNFIPIPLGADVTSSGKRPAGQDSYAPPGPRMIRAPL